VDVVVLQGEREQAADNRVLGRVRLENIRPAARGMPQIEVTFDIDANGILNVSARDKDTGVEQNITISESGTLDEAEVQRMVTDAERHQAEDARARQLIEARNELDTASYQVERLVSERGDAVAVHDKARAETLVADARQAVKEQAPLERVRALTADLQQMLHGLSATTAAGTGADGSAQPGRSGAAGGRDDVIDAEFTTG
jgi:molecular chaperone DnaK